MPGGLVALFDDVAALAKAAAASVDDVGAAAGRATAKAAGVVVDDAAVTPRFVTGVSASRELAVVWRIARGSLRNKLLVILPVMLALTELLPAAVPIVLLVGGCYLAFEGTHKVLRHGSHHEERPAYERGKDAEDALVSGAVRTDFVLSAEIMVIAADEVGDGAFVGRAVTLVVVAIVITAAVYGTVAGIVKMDDLGVRIARRGSESARRVGRLLVRGTNRVLGALTVVGTAAMLWVGGHIIVEAADELSFRLPYEVAHEARESLRSVPAVGGPLGWAAETAVSALFGLVIGYLLVHLLERVKPHSADSVGGGEESREHVR
ncbi:MAG: ABC transporter [Acidimicrobiales bacterium]|nr:MAG: ABC transporter [Acidimicrobiales bacterium]